jgi:hypothetical protein
MNTTSRKIERAVISQRGIWTQMMLQFPSFYLPQNHIKFVIAMSGLSFYTNNNSIYNAEDGKVINFV